jgi:hypothetical protein
VGEWSALDSSLAFEKAVAAVSLAVITLAGLIPVLAGYFIVTECMGGQDQGGSKLARPAEPKNVATRTPHYEDRAPQRAAAMAASNDPGPRAV